MGNNHSQSHLLSQLPHNENRQARSFPRIDLLGLDLIMRVAFFKRNTSFIFSFPFFFSFFLGGSFKGSDKAQASLFGRIFPWGSQLVGSSFCGSELVPFSDFQRERPEASEKDPPLESGSPEGLGPKERPLFRYQDSGGSNPA